jgi:hypothetical protein
MRPIFTDQELAIKAQKIRETDLLGDGTEAPENKQLVFYVLAGVKPLSEVLSLHMEELSDDNLQPVPDNQEKVMAFFKELGLTAEARDDGQYLVSLDKKYIDAYLQALAQGRPADIYRAVGQAFGYPTSAVEACVSDWVNDDSSLLTYDEQDAYITEAGLPIDACVFRLSRAHYQAEIAEVKRWYAVLQKYDMLV